MLLYFPRNLINATTIWLWIKLRIIIYNRWSSSFALHNSTLWQVTRSAILSNSRYLKMHGWPGDLLLYFFSEPTRELSLIHKAWNPFSLYNLALKEEIEHNTLSFSLLTFSFSYKQNNELNSYELDNIMCHYWRVLIVLVVIFVSRSSIKWRRVKGRWWQTDCAIFPSVKCSMTKMKWRHRVMVYIESVWSPSHLPLCTVHAQI